MYLFTLIYTYVLFQTFQSFQFMLVLSSCLTFLLAILVADFGVYGAQLLVPWRVSSCWFGWKPGVTQSMWWSIKLWSQKHRINAWCIHLHLIDTWKKQTACLGFFFGDFTTQLCWDSFINQGVRIPSNQRGFNGKSEGSFRVSYPPWN